MSDEDRSDSFKVSDRRLFTEEGELREDRPPEPAAAPKSAEAPRPAPERDTPSRTGKNAGSPHDARPGMDFSSFLLSLATTALVHLGEVSDPSGARATTNLDAARQMVDILSMLQVKTEGNRSPEENRLLDDILYELRMKILTKTKAIQL